MGKLYGIGVGPGDPELLTLKAYKILQQADVIFCPEKKKGAVGVRGMKLNAGDALSNIYVLDGESEETVEVKGKEVVLNRLRVGNRDTKGTKR